MAIDYALTIVVGLCTGIGSATGAVLVELYIKPYLQKLKEQKMKLEDINRGMQQANKNIKRLMEVKL